MVSYMTDQKVFVITTPYCSHGTSVAVDSFLLVLHSQETPSIKLLHSLKEQEVSVINMWRDVNMKSMKGIWHNKLGTQPALHGISVIMTSHSSYTKLSWVSYCQKMEQQILHFRGEVKSCTGRKSGCHECHMAVWWHILPLGWLQKL
jgi:hypothetical protein